MSLHDLDAALNNLAGRLQEGGAVEPQYDPDAEPLPPKGSEERRRVARYLPFNDDRFPSWGRGGRFPEPDDTEDTHVHDYVSDQLVGNMSSTTTGVEVFKAGKAQEYTTALEELPNGLWVKVEQINIDAKVPLDRWPHHLIQDADSWTISAKAARTLEDERLLDLGAEEVDSSFGDASFLRQAEESLRKMIAGDKRRAAEEDAAAQPAKKAPRVRRKKPTPPGD